MVFNAPKLLQFYNMAQFFFILLKKNGCNPFPARGQSTVCVNMVARKILFFLAVVLGLHYLCILLSTTHLSFFES